MKVTVTSGTTGMTLIDLVMCYDVDLSGHHENQKFLSFFMGALLLSRRRISSTKHFQVVDVMSLLQLVRGREREREIRMLKRVKSRITDEQKRFTTSPTSLRAAQTIRGHCRDCCCVLP